MKKILIGLLSLVFMFGLAGAVYGSDWLMFNNDLQNTGVANPGMTGISTPVELWSYTTDNQIGSGSPIIGDIDNDGDPDILVPTANFANTGGIYALDKDGSLKWKYQTGDKGTYATPPLADIDGDGKLETIFPSYNGKIVAVDDDGTQMWIVDKGSAGTRSVIADVTGDSGLEVVAGAASKTFLLKASDGTQLWVAAYRLLSDPAIADVDGDGKMEVVFSASGKIIVALNAEDGTVAWTSTLMGQDAQNNVAIISDINGDSKPDVVAGARDKKFYVFSGADGTQIWNYTVIGKTFSAAVADFNGDGFDDVVTTATKADGIKSYVYLLDVKNKVLLWQQNIVGKKYYSTERSPSIADVNGDGTPDVLIVGLSQKLYALNGTDGSELWTINTNNPSAGVPAIGDINNDGIMDIVVSAGSSVQVFTGLDTTSPEITFVEPEDESIHSGTINLKATCNENCDYINFWWRAKGEAYGDYRYHYVHEDGVEFEWGLDTLNAEKANSDYYLMDDGVYYLYAAGKDLAGNWARTTGEVMININNTPDDKDDCKKDGWSTWLNPTFKNQGDCVSYLMSNEKAGKRD